MPKLYGVTLVNIYASLSVCRTVEVLREGGVQGREQAPAVQAKSGICVYIILQGYSVPFVHAPSESRINSN